MRRSAGRLGGFVAEKRKVGDGVKHWKKIVLMIGVGVLTVLLFGAIFGFSRLTSDFFPLDKATVGSGIFASFIWIPIALVGGWIVSDIRADAALEKHRIMLQEQTNAYGQLLADHHAAMKKTNDEHFLHMASLLGIDDQAAADALNSTPGDRQLDEVPLDTGS